MKIDWQVRCVFLQDGVLELELAILWIVSKKQFSPGIVSCAIIQPA